MFSVCCFTAAAAAYDAFGGYDSYGYGDEYYGYDDYGYDYYGTEGYGGYGGYGQAAAFQAPAVPRGRGSMGVVSNSSLVLTK